MPLLVKHNLKGRWTGLRGQAGSAAITGVLMTMLLLGIISQQFYDYYSAKVQRQFSANRFETRRDAIMLMVKRNVRSGVVLFSSVIGAAKKIENAALYSCLFNEQNDPVGDDCITNSQSPVAFYFDDGTKFTGSSEVDGVCYREDGAIASPTDTCVFKVWTTFRPVCKYVEGSNPADYDYDPSCKVAMALNVQIEVKLIDPNGMARQNRTATSYVNVNDTYHYGQWAYIAIDVKDGKLPYENWWFWWHGKTAPVNCTAANGPVDPSCPCMDVTADPVTGLYACGDGQAGFGGPPGPTPAGWDSGIPASTPCPPGQIYRGGSCSTFML